MNREEEKDPLVIVISDNEERNQINKEQVLSKTNNEEDDLIELCTVQRVARKSTTYYNDDELRDRCQVYKRWNIKLKANPNENLSLSNHKMRLKKTTFDALTTKSRNYKFNFYQEEEPQQSQPRNQTNTNFIEIDALKSIHPSNRNMNFSLLPKQEIENLKKEDLIYDSYYASSAYFKRKHHVQSRPTPTFSSNSKEKKRYHTNNQSNNISSMSKRQRYH